MPAIPHLTILSGITVSTPVSYTHLQHAGVRHLRSALLAEKTILRKGADNALLSDGGMFIRNGSGALMSAWAAAGRLIGYLSLIHIYRAQNV